MESDMKGIKTASRSETGLARKDNQDSVLCLDDLGVFVVADGMGGGSAGALASQMVCEALQGGVSAKDYPNRLDEIESAIFAANARIFAHAKEHGFRQMGSTVALLSVDESYPSRGVIGYVGDSRVYRVRGGVAALLTRDHSVGAELEDKVGAAAGSRYSARSNPLAHILTRAVGSREEVFPDWRKVDIFAGDRFVICSDGVCDVVETEALGRHVSAQSIEDAADSLAAEVVAKGAPDNFSFVIVEIGGVQ